MSFDLDTFIDNNKADIRFHLGTVVSDLKAAIEMCPKDYIELGTDEPSIDVRLIIDPETASWNINTGSSDCDQWHSEYCVASCVTLDTTTDDLFTELLSQF
jgi:hypothetical protein